MRVGEERFRFIFFSEIIKYPRYNLLIVHERDEGDRQLFPSRVWIYNY